MFFKKKIPDVKKIVLSSKNDAVNHQNDNKTVDVIKPLTKRIKKDKPVWDAKYTLIDVQFPIAIEKEGLKKKYKLNITFKDKENKIRKKTIRFGKKSVNDYIDDFDENKKKKIINKLGNTHNLFHPNFWRFHLLNGEAKTLKENFIDLKQIMQIY